ncbi:MAG: hypothetical protein WCP29_18965 [Acidobacteriota bacterium]
MRPDLAGLLVGTIVAALDEAWSLGASGGYPVTATGVRYEEFGAMQRQCNGRYLVPVVSTAYRLAAKVDGSPS